MKRFAVLPALLLSSHSARSGQPSYRPSATFPPQTGKTRMKALEEQVRTLVEK